MLSCVKPIGACERLGARGVDVLVSASRVRERQPIFMKTYLKELLSRTVQGDT